MSKYVCMGLYITHTHRETHIYTPENKQIYTAVYHLVTLIVNWLENTRCCHLAEAKQVWDLPMPA